MVHAFHVTSESNVDSIKKNGLQAGTEKEWQQKRQELRRKVDDYASQHTSQWIPRENANYFWTELTDAMEYIHNISEYGSIEGVVIITVEIQDTPIWAAESEYIEELYHKWMNNENVNVLLGDLETHVERWNGNALHGYEVWTQEDISSDKIVQID